MATSITEKELKKIFSSHKDNPMEALYQLQDHGYAEGLISKLGSNAETGLKQDEQALEERRKQFGSNAQPKVEGEKGGCFRVFGKCCFNY